MGALGVEDTHPTLAIWEDLNIIPARTQRDTLAQNMLSRLLAQGSPTINRTLIGDSDMPKVSSWQKSLTPVPLGYDDNTIKYAFEKEARLHRRQAIYTSYIEYAIFASPSNSLHVLHIMKNRDKKDHYLASARLEYKDREIIARLRGSCIGLASTHHWLNNGSKICLRCRVKEETVEHFWPECAGNIIQRYQMQKRFEWMTPTTHESIREHFEHILRNEPYNEISEVLQMMLWERKCTLQR
jgi:hypothetical protein